MPSITGLSSAGSTEPVDMLELSTQQRAATIVQEIVGSESPWFSLAAARSREGSMVALYESETDAEAARVLLSGPEVFELEYTELPTLSKTFVVVGDGLRVTKRSPRFWSLNITYREVPT